MEDKSQRLQRLKQVTDNINEHLTGLDFPDAFFILGSLMAQAIFQSASDEAAANKLFHGLGDIIELQINTLYLKGGGNVAADDTQNLLD